MLAVTEVCSLKVYNYLNKSVDMAVVVLYNYCGKNIKFQPSLFIILNLKYVSVMISDVMIS